MTTGRRRSTFQESTPDSAEQLEREHQAYTATHPASERLPQLRIFSDRAGQESERPGGTIRR